MMKAYKVGTAHTEVQVRPVHQGKGECQELLADTIAWRKVQLMARTDRADRIARVEELQAQLQAGTYQVDSQKIAGLMYAVPFVQEILGLGSQDLSVPKE